MARSFRHYEDEDQRNGAHSRRGDFRNNRRLARQARDGELDTDVIEGLRARLGSPRQ